MSLEAELLQRLDDALKADRTVQLVVGPVFLTRSVMIIEIRRAGEVARCACFATLTDALGWALNVLEKRL